MKKRPRKRKSATQIAFTIITILILVSMVLGIIVTTLPR